MQVPASWFSEHPHLYTLAVLVAYWCIAALINRLPAPTEKSGSLYKSLYTSLQGFAANLKQSAEGLHALLPKPAVKK